MYDLVLNENLVKKSKEKKFNEIFYLDPSLIIKTDKKEEISKKVSSFHSKNKVIVVLGSTNDINRMVLEDKRIDMLLNPEEIQTKDFMHWRSSGLNHILCKLATKNNIKIGISFASLAGLQGKERSLRFGKIMQNIRLCRKYNTKMVIASFAKSENELVSSYGLKSLGITLGMTPKQANESLLNAKDLFEK